MPNSPIAVPATFVTPLVVDVSCSPSRTPVFVNGPSGTYTRVTGPCAPAVMVRLGTVARLLQRRACGELLVGRLDIPRRTRWRVLAIHIRRRLDASPS